MTTSRLASPRAATSLTPHPLAQRTFEALAVGFLASNRELEPRAVNGERPGLRYGGIGTALPGFNRMMLTRLDTRTADADLDEAIAVLDRFPVQSAWVPANVEPGDAVERLLARGFLPDDEEPTVPAMTRSLAGLPPLELGSGVTITRVVDRAGVVEANRIVASAFDAPKALADIIADLFGDSLLDPGSSARAFIVRDSGTAVATALGSVTGSTLVIYNVGTLAAARRRGFGSLATLAVMHDGVGRGAEVAVLESSEAGYPVYLRLGFEDVGRFTVLVRRGSASADR